MSYPGGNVDPSREAAPKQWSKLGHDSSCTDYCCYIVGPGGKETNIENNEKGMLDSVVLSIMATTVADTNHSMHDPYARGIYVTHSYASDAEMAD